MSHLFTISEQALRNQTFQVLGGVRVCLDITWQAKSTPSQHSNKLFGEVVTVVRDRVVLVGRVFLSHSRNQNIVDFERCQLAYTFRLFLTLDRNREFELKGTVTLRCVQIDTRLTRHRTTTVRKLLFAHLDRTMVQSEA